MAVRAVKALCPECVRWLTPYWPTVNGKRCTTRPEFRRHRSMRGVCPGSNMGVEDGNWRGGMSPEQVDAVLDVHYPRRGPCGICGVPGHDQRHRVLDSLAGAITAGDDPEAALADHGILLEALPAVLAYYAQDRAD